MKAERNQPVLWAIPWLLTACLVSVPVQAKYGGGAGTADDPYQIWTAEQMNAIGAEPNDWDKHFKLMADIDLGQYMGSQFNIIGNPFDPQVSDGWSFCGVFDGNGHAIAHFSHGCTDQNDVGLFRSLSGIDSEIRDLILVDPNVGASGGCNVGSLVGYAVHGTILRCRVIDGIVRGGKNVGGLVGKSGPEVERLSARVYPRMSVCCFDGEVHGQQAVGGLVGYNLSGGITLCYTTGDVAGSDSAGGLAGINESGWIEACYAIVDVTGENVVGGLVGNSLSTISNSYAAGRVTGSGQVGGLVGSGSHGVLGSLWDAQTSGQSTSAGGAAKTTGGMQTSATFFYWNACDSAASWTIDEGHDYPRLGWEGRPGRLIEPVRLADRIQGTGSEGDPFLIHTADELNLIALYRCERDKHFKLMADLDLSVYTEDEFNIIWQFSGTFDGNHHAIANLTYRAQERDWAGLFAMVYGVIKDLELISPSIDVGTGSYAGALAGDAWQAAIVNCRVAGGAVSGARGIGGLIGSITGTVISDCHAATDIMGTYSVGGLIGGNGESTVARCSASGKVTGDERVGGLVGRNTGKVTASYASGCVEGNSYIGGLVGDNNYASATLDCYAVGEVTADHAVGGLVGSNQGTIADCYATGRVTGVHDVGGLLGRKYPAGDVFVSFWDISTSGISTSAAGIGKTTAQMQQESAFKGWGEDGLWTLDEGRDYPRLAWENEPGKPITLCALAPAPGTGSPDDPYLISTAEQLNSIGLFPATWNKHFRLAANIDLSANVGISFNVIGTEGLPFTGVFDGDDHMIFHLDGNYSERENTGMFGWVNDPNAEIRNVILKDASIDAHGYEWSAATLIGHLERGLVEDCHATGHVESHFSFTGGLIGYCGESAEVMKCSAAVSVRADWFTGGLIGNSEGTVVDCSASGPVVGVEEAGGLIGGNNGAVTNCCATGKVSARDFAGGLIGGNSMFGVVRGCRATGDVDAKNWAGGLVGANWEGTIKDSCATGGVDSNDYGGGLVAANDGVIRGCYASPKTSESAKPSRVEKAMDSIVRRSSFSPVGGLRSRLRVVFVSCGGGFLGLAG